MYLIDTNVVSELRKGPRCHPGVRRFFRTAASDALFIPAQVVGELRKGAEMIRLRNDRDQADLLDRWLDMVLLEYRDRILDFDLECAQLWGRLMAKSPQHPIDRQIASIALLYDFTVVTRNTSDFAGTGTPTLDPFLDH